MVEWHDYFMMLTFAIATKSKDTNTHIGALIIGPGHEIRSTGFNGLPRGLKESDVRNAKPEKYFWYEHGERNAIYNAARNGVSLVGCTLYTNGIPCADCARAVIQSGITTVVVDKSWNDDNSQKWVESCSRSLEMFKESGTQIIYWSGEVNIEKFRNGKSIAPKSCPASGAVTTPGGRNP